jgi:hypothetical protein
MEMPMSHRLWWRVTDILPLAAHADATARHIPFPGRQPSPWWMDCPALFWTSGPDGDWLSSNGSPLWYAADGSSHRVRAETWSHPATGTTGNPAQRDPADGFLPLLAEHHDGRRTLLDLLRFARRTEANWFGLDPDPATHDTNTRYLITDHRGDLLPPDATWIPAIVTSTAVNSREYRALVADGYTALDGGVLVRFPPDTLRQLIDEQYEAFLDDDTGTVAQLSQFGDLLIVQRQEHDGTDLHWIEDDRCYPDADGCYLVGAYQWRWTRTSP